MKDLCSNFPAKGFFTTATAATLRSGICAGWPASLREFVDESENFPDVHERSSAG